MNGVDSWACSINGSEFKNPALPKTGRIGHPEKLIRSPGVDVLEWYHSKMRVRQLKKHERVGHPPAWRPNMMSHKERFLVRFVVCLLLLQGFGRNAVADTLVMPRELVDYAHANGCSPIDNFFERPGMVSPPFVYGWLAGSPEHSAVFWCKKTEPSDKPYKLMLKVSDPKQLAGCPVEIEWWNPPRGLSIETRSHLDLGDFRSVTAPKRPGPKSVIDDA